MSYEPTIIALKRDFDKNKQFIVDGDWQYHGTKENKKDEKTRGGEDGTTVMEYIKYAYEKHKPVLVGGLELIVLSPSFTSFNGLVRKKLDELGIEYGLDN